MPKRRRPASPPATFAPPPPSAASSPPLAAAAAASADATAADAATAADDALPDVPVPRPLAVGDRVLAQPPSPAAAAPRAAVVVALDDTYVQAAASAATAAAAAAATAAATAAAEAPPTVDLTADDDVDASRAQDVSAPGASPTLLVRHTSHRAHNTGRTTMTDAPAPSLGRVYVHFDGTDARLDRWLPAGSVRCVVPPPPPPQPPPPLQQQQQHAQQQLPAATRSAERPRKLTRLLKRVIEGESVAPPMPSAAAAAVATAAAAADRLTSPAAAATAAAAAASAAKPPNAASMGPHSATQHAAHGASPATLHDLNVDTPSVAAATAAVPQVRNVSTLVFGAYEIDAWYCSPFPPPFDTADRLYACDPCLTIMHSQVQYLLHRRQCPANRPPGSLVYEDASRRTKVYEVDGALNPIFCAHLCLIGKLFIDHKVLHFDVAPFLFYVVSLRGEIAGFFSKQKPLVGSEFNLSCIVTFPQHQRKGVGRFLIALSYELTKLERRTGSPERPLSDLGELSYRSYWTHAIVRWLRTNGNGTNIPAEHIARETAIAKDDVVATLRATNLLQNWKNEAYAGNYARTLEAAVAKLSEPLLPLQLRSLREDAIHDANGAIGLNSTPRVVKLGTQNKTKSKSATKAASNANAVKATASKTPKKTRKRATASGGGASKTAAGMENGRSKVEGRDRDAVFASDVAFSDKHLIEMKKFIEMKTPEAVCAPVQSLHGVSNAEYEDLARTLGLEVARCRKKLRNMASSVLEHGGGYSTPVSGGGGSGRQGDPSSAKRGQVAVHPTVVQSELLAESLGMPFANAREAEKFRARPVSGMGDHGKVHSGEKIGAGTYRPPPVYTGFREAGSSGGTAFLPNGGVGSSRIASSGPSLRKVRQSVGFKRSPGDVRKAEENDVVVVIDES